MRELYREHKSLTAHIIAEQILFDKRFTDNFKSEIWHNQNRDWTLCEIKILVILIESRSGKVSSTAPQLWS